MKRVWSFIQTIDGQMRLYMSKLLHLKSILFGEKFISCSTLNQLNGGLSGGIIHAKFNSNIPTKKLLLSEKELTPLRS